MKRSAIILALAVLLVLAAVVWMSLPSPPKQERQLADGSTLSLERVKIGQVNEFVHGNLQERTLGRVVPEKGIRILGWQIGPPVKQRFGSPEATSLSMEFKLANLPAAAIGGGARGGRAQASNLFWSRERRAIVTGDNGFQYFCQPTDFQPGGEYFLYVNTPLFPRGAKTVHVRLESRASSRDDWQTVAEFNFQQRPARDQSWKPEPPARRRTVDGIQIELGDVTVRPGTFVRGDIWDQTVLISWRITHDGMVLTNWNANDVVISDTSGNADYFGTQKTVTNGWITSRIWRSPDPSKVWKIRAGLSPDSGHAATNLFTVRIPYPSGTDIETNLGGLPLHIGFVNQVMLDVELLATNRTDLRLSFVHAEDQDGRKLDQWTGSWSQFRFWKELQLSAASNTTVVATFAIDKNIPVEFLVQPRRVRAGESVGGGQVLGR